MNKTKVLHLNSAFTIKAEPSSTDGFESVYIEGYASTNDIDRSGDVVPTSVWEKGMQNYLKNPVILAHHDHDDPCGRMTEHKIDSKGLWIKARISSAAEEVFNLVKDGLITAFSIGFRIMDAEYNAAAEVFMVKELELVEISVVSVPCNQNTLFELAKAFDSAEEFKSYKEQFVPKSDAAKGLESHAETSSTNQKEEWNMNPEELKQMLADAAKSAAVEATQTLLAAQKAEREALEAKAAKDAEFAKQVEAAVKSHITVGQSGAEKLLEDVKKSFEQDSADTKKALEALRAEVADKAAEISAMQKSKMSFTDKGDASGSSYAERETAYLLSRITGKSITSTKFGNQVVEKAGAHLPSNTWELEVSMNMEAEVRRRLVAAPLFRAINMATNVMTIPVNPEAGLATWVTNAQFGTTASAGAAQTHVMKEITLNAYKVATLEYLAFEEEEDSLLAIMPIVRDAMIRRVARAMDKAYLVGAGSGADPVKGAAIYDVTSVVVPTSTGQVTVANMRALRKDIGAWGLDTADVTYIVNTEVYYDLLEDTTFQTMDKVGPKATLLTGQIGMIGNSPVLVSSELPVKASGAATASTNIGALCIAAGNFISGNQRGLRFDTQDMAETQRKVLVASLRTGLTQVTTNLGQGVSVLRFS